MKSNGNMTFMSMSFAHNFLKRRYRTGTRLVRSSGADKSTSKLSGYALW